MATEPNSEDMEHKTQEEEVAEKASSPCTPSSSPSMKPEHAAETSPEAAASSSPFSAKGAAVKTSALETLAIPLSLPPNSGFFTDGTHGIVDCRSFSQLLAGAMASPSGNSRSSQILALPIDGMRLPVVAVPCIIAPAALLDSPGFAGQFAMTHQAVLATVQAHAQMQLQTAYSSPSVISTINPLPLQQVPPPALEVNGVSSVVESPSSVDQKPQIDRSASKITTSGDGFNWRKYGQKQVKSGENSRSYYKCTHAGCLAKKKIERCQDGHVVEIIYRGDHSHEPPQKPKSLREREPPSEERETPKLAIKASNGSVEPTPKVFSRRPSLKKPKVSTETKPQCNEIIALASEDMNESGSATSDRPIDRDGDAHMKTEEALDEPSPKRSRIKEPSLASPVTPLSKTIREQRVVVQKVADGGFGSDGYRWRKYGQKFVKGNPNPRSYYRCTQIGCPVRKHVEKDAVDVDAFVITYEGEHSHNRPPPKHDSDSPALLIAAAAAAKTITQTATTDAESKLAEHGGDQTLESAETLLSIGLDPAAGGGDEEAIDEVAAPAVVEVGSDAMQRPLFSESSPVTVHVQNS